MTRNQIHQHHIQALLIFIYFWAVGSAQIPREYLLQSLARSLSNSLDDSVENRRQALNEEELQVWEALSPNNIERRPCSDPEPANKEMIHLGMVTIEGYPPDPAKSRFYDFLASRILPRVEWYIKCMVSDDGAQAEPCFTQWRKQRWIRWTHVKAAKWEKSREKIRPTYVGLIDSACFEFMFQL